MREDYWGGDLASGERKRCGNNCFKGNEYWFWLGTEVDQAKVSVHIYDSDGKLAEQPDSWAERTTLRLRTSFQRPPAVTLSSSAWRNRQKNARIGRWCMVSGRVGSVALAPSQYAIGKDADATNADD